MTLEKRGVWFLAVAVVGTALLTFGLGLLTQLHPFAVLASTILLLGIADLALCLVGPLARQKSLRNAVLSSIFSGFSFAAALYLMANPAKRYLWHALVFLLLGWATNKFVTRRLFRTVQSRGNAGGAQ